MGKIYHGWFELGEDLKESTKNSALPADEQTAVLDKFEERWLYGHSGFAAAAYVVDPEFRTHDHASNTEVMEGFFDTVEKIGILLEVRRHKVKYTQLWQQRKGMLEMDPYAYKNSDLFPKYPTSETPAVREFCVKVNEQLVMFRNAGGTFARPWVLKTAEGMPAHLWWSQYGACVKELQTFACLVLAQAGSSSICERINSEFNFVVDRRRNRLVHRKANKLVSLFHNLRLMQRQKKTSYTVPAVAWTENVEDSSGITRYGVANYA